MIRRSFLVAVAGLAASTGCATITQDDAVATVDGTEISQEAFDVVADDYFGRDDLFGTTPVTAGRRDGDQSRLLLSAMVRQQVLRDVLDAGSVDAASTRRDFIDTTFADPIFDDLSTETLELMADADPTFAATVLSTVPAADADQLEAWYRDHPLKVGMLCLRHILVETEAEAEAVLAELDDGADFAELAAERSLDESNAAEGGALATPAGACIPLRTIAQGFDPAFVEAVFDSSASGLIGPVETSFGWHVILHRPWEEVADSVVALHTETDSGGYQYDGRLAAGDVTVAPPFGTWDPVAGGVVVLG